MPQRTRRQIAASKREQPLRVKGKFAKKNDESKSMEEDDGDDADDEDHVGSEIEVSSEEEAPIPPRKAVDCFSSDDELRDLLIF